jgi:hypothetical protein
MFQRFKRCWFSSKTHLISLSLFGCWQQESKSKTNWFIVLVLVLYCNRHHHANLNAAVADERT